MPVRRRARSILVWVGAAALVAALLPAGTAYAATDILPPTVDAPTGVVPPINTSYPVSVRPSQFGGATPARYQYAVGQEQQHPGKLHTIRPHNGVATFTFTPVSRTTFLWVYAVAADGTVSAPTVALVFGHGTSQAVSKDVDGDGRPDVLTIGGTPGLPSGLWLASGRPDGPDGSGHVRRPAKNIGINGFMPGGFTSADFDGLQLITGNFVYDQFEDVMVYYASGDARGQAMILHGSGDGSVLASQYQENQSLISMGIFTDANGDDPLLLADAYRASGPGVIDDLIGVTGDPGNGYHLAYYLNPFSYSGDYYAKLLPASTPTGGTDWNDWPLASTLVPGGTALYLWNRTTGELYLWLGLTFTDDGDGTGSVTYRQYHVADHWNQGVALSTVEAADFSGDGVPDLWAVTADGKVTAYTVTDLSTTHLATVTAQHQQSLQARQIRRGSGSPDPRLSPRATPSTGAARERHPGLRGVLRRDVQTRHRTAARVHRRPGRGAGPGSGGVHPGVHPMGEDIDLR